MGMWPLPPRAQPRREDDVMPKPRIRFVAEDVSTNERTRRLGPSSSNRLLGGGQRAAVGAGALP